MDAETTEWRFDRDHHHTIPQIACWLKGEKQDFAVEVSGCHHVDSMVALDLTVDRMAGYYEHPDVAKYEII